MPLQIPTRKSLVLSGQSYMRSNVPEWDPSTSRRSFVGALVKSLMSAIHDWYVSLKLWTDIQAWPQTATGDFFSGGWWIPLTDLPRRAAAPAAGRVILTGTVGSFVPADTSFSSGQNTYHSTSDATLVAQSLVGTSSVYDGITGQFVTEEPHLLASGMSLSFSGMSDSALNGTFEIEVIDATTIRFETNDVAGQHPLQPNPRASGVWASVVVEADVTGPAGNLDSGSTVTATSAPAGVDTLARVCFDGVADGSDVETLESWRSRVLQALGTDYGTFSADEIIQVARTVPGVTRVFVRKPTRQPTLGYPLEGQVRIAFLRENDADPIPSALEVAQVRTAIHSTILPAHMVPDDCEILAPERYPLAVVFRSISPDTRGMRDSIEANVRQFLIEEATWGGTLESEGLRCAIRAAIDPNTGARLRKYDLITPTTDITLPDDGYPVLTSITWRTI